jgi:hypothetical protein
VPSDVRRSVRAPPEREPRRGRDRQAAAVQRHAVADANRARDLRARIDLELEPLPRRFEPRDQGDALDDSREHG